MRRHVRTALAAMVLNPFQRYQVLRTEAITDARPEETVFVKAFIVVPGFDDEFAVLAERVAESAEDGKGIAHMENGLGWSATTTMEPDLRGNFDRQQGLLSHALLTTSSIAGMSAGCWLCRLN